MKRTLILLCVVGMLVAIPLSHSAFAKTRAAPPAKVTICHIIAENDVAPLFGKLYAFGIEITVSEKALSAHEAHGDSATFIGGDAAATGIEWAREAGAIIVNANCAVAVD